MKNLLVVVILTTSSFGLTQECEDATAHAIQVHVKYMAGKTTLTASYNAEAKAEKICKGQ